MGRPSLAAVRRPQILEAYESCIVRYGLEGATLDRVAREAGVTRGLVRHYLGNRDDVLLALGAHVQERYSSWLQEIVASNPSSDRMAALLDALLTDEIPPELYQVVSELFWVATGDQKIARLLHDVYAEFEHTIDAALAAELPEADPRARRQVAFGILCLAFSAPDFQTMGFPADRRRAGREAARRLVDSLR
jgi:AcrR family transcriptional regulator